MKRYTDKIYFALFFWLGFAWFSHSVRFAWPAMCSLVAFYFFHNVILHKGKDYISNSFAPFLLLGVFIVFHCMASNLIQLVSFTENTFYRTYSGISTGARMFMNISCLYVIFRYISRLREGSSGLFFKCFSHGANFFLVMFLLFGQFSYEGILKAQFALDGNDEAFYLWERVWE